MERSVDLSISKRTRQYLVAGFFSLLVALGLSLPVSILVETATGIGSLWVVLVVIVVLWGSLTVLWVRLAGEPGEGTAWDHVPGWQYDGRFVEAGGLARDEQERALGRSDDEE